MEPFVNPVAVVAVNSIDPPKQETENGRRDRQP